MCRKSKIRCGGLIYLISFVVLLASAAVKAEFGLVENFDSMATGKPDGLACTGVMGGTWDTEGEDTGNVNIEDRDGSRVLQFRGHSSGDTRGVGFNGITNTIDNSEIGKVFFRVMLRSDSATPLTYIGLISDMSADPITDTGTNTRTDIPTSIPAGFGLLDNGAGGFDLVKTDGTTVLKAGLARTQWYNVWIVADNSADTFDLCLSEATGPAGEATLPNPEDLVERHIPFGVATAEPLNGMIFACPTGTGQSTRTYIDEIYWDGDKGLWTPKKARNPNLVDGATDVPLDVVLSWTAGAYADKHDVYFGTNFNNVNDADRTNPLGVLVSQNQEPNSYSHTEVLQWEQTYYWRIDEVNAPPDYTVYKGDVWSFMAEPFAYPIAGTSITATASSLNAAEEGPENTINGSGLDADDLHSAENTAMWLSNMIGPQPTWIQYELDQVYKLHQMLVWNHNTSIEPVIGFGIKEAAIEYSTDGASWTTLGTHEFARGSGAAGLSPNTTVDLSGVAAKYIKITANSNWGGIINQYGLSEVRFFYAPVVAREPDPASGATDMDVDNVTLSWRAGREAASHNLYFSSNQQAVIDETISPVSIPADSSYANYNTGALELGQTCYWKVNEVSEAETPTTWQGELWDFTTQEYFVVDDIEDYNDFEPDRIFDTWSDGWNVPANGSQVGSDAPPFAEQTIVHSGKQSMPLHYDNSTANYSEATANVAILQVGQDWTKYGIRSLSLWFYGDPNNSVTEQMYVKLNGSKVIYGGDAANLKQELWKRWSIDLASFGVNPAPVAGVGVNLSNVTELSIGLERSGVVGGKGVVYFDDIRLYPSRCIPEIRQPGADLNDDCVVNYLDLEILAGEWLLELVNASDVGIWREAESADSITSPMKIYDDPIASGGQYIGTDDGIGDEYDAAPPDGIATYNFTVAGGVYKILFRVIAVNGNDSIWVRVPGATNLTSGEDPDQPGTGWVRFNGIDAGAAWHWDEVHSDEHGEQVTNWTLPAGQHTLEIARREAGTLLDAILITNNLDLDQRTLLPDGVSSDLNEDRRIDFKDFAGLADGWLDEQLWPSANGG